LWSLDSGAFTELTRSGRWTIEAPAFVDEVQRIVAGVGSAPDWVGPRDWMCEPAVLAKTGLTVAEHQERTCADYVDLRERAPGVPWLPVLQGWAPREYGAHRRRYERWGVRLEDAPLVGVGTVCRRQHTREVASLLRELGTWGLRLHGFGVKVSGLTAPGGAEALESADSMAWSYQARVWSYRNGYRSWCGSEAHDDCSSCPAWARSWYDGVVGRLPEHAP
jgi:hypothetical protein